jgi:ElaB/YqjD/DUF883 family membrane-anchored ribosome-binding protein
MARHPNPKKQETPMNDATPRSVASGEDDLRHQIEVLRADVAKLMGTLSEDLTAGIGKASHQITQAGHDARVAASNTVIAHPLTAVGLAVGLGLLLGMIARKG